MRRGMKGFGQDLSVNYLHSDCRRTFQVNFLPLVSFFPQPAHLSRHIAIRSTCLKYHLMHVSCSGTISGSLLLLPWSGTHLSWSSPSPAPKPRASASLLDRGLKSQTSLEGSKHTVCSHPLIPAGLWLLGLIYPLFQSDSDPNPSSS